MRFLLRSHKLLLPLLLATGGALSCNDPQRQQPPGSVDRGNRDRCATTFTYEEAEDADLDQIYIVGDFNRWDSRATPLEEVEDGRWQVELDLPPGAHPYRFVEFTAWSHDGHEALVCDPRAELIHCGDGYKEPGDTNWRHDCSAPAETACNSMVVVPDCALPQVELSQVEIDRDAGSLSVTAVATPGSDASEISDWQATLDGESVELARDGSVLTGRFDGLASGRHTLRLTVEDDAGQRSEELYLPVWTDAAGDDAWRQGPIYFAFVDRLANGDVSIDGSEGATAPIADYAGGDFQGVIDLLDYLDELGVRTLWLSNPQDNAEGAWAGDCDAVFAGYHAYWPDQARAVEEHFGDEDALRTLVDEAHDRGMRVIMDWVANHVHEDHPYYADAIQDQREDWFNSQAICKDSSGGQSNWDRIPEQCWFAPYLPDIDYTQPDALDRMVDDALWWVRTYGFDGLRVDAVKHMPHSVAWNLEARIRREIEHRHAGGDEQFWTVGETFDGHERIAAYINDGDDLLGLDGQFDFPMYYAVGSVFGSVEADLSALESTLEAGEAAWEGALMSSFLGNHDVMRFTTESVEGQVSSCEEGVGLRSAGLPWDPHIYTRMALAWTFLYTQPAVPLVYYGDEIGLPGYTDPDNRQPLWWHAEVGAGDGVEDVAARLDADRAALLRHVAALGQARQQHPATWRGQTTEWWRAPSEAPTLWAYARVDARSGDQVLVILNRSDSGQTLSNGLSFAGLDEGGAWVDALSGERFEAEGDNLSLWVPAWSSRLLVPE